MIKLIQFNCRLPESTYKWIQAQAKRLSREKGMRVSQAEVVHMLVLASPFYETQVTEKEK